MKNLQEQVKKAFGYQNCSDLSLFDCVWINCSSDLKIFANLRLKAEFFKSFSRSLEQFFLTVGQNQGAHYELTNIFGQNNFGNKIPFRDAWSTNDECTSTYDGFQKSERQNKKNWPTLMMEYAVLIIFKKFWPFVCVWGWSFWI